MSDPAALAARLQAGDRTALAQAITLIESTRSDHRDTAEDLLAAILPASGRSLRLGVTGAPGVGKSTFIETFGLMSLAAGRRVAVLAVDPSSKTTGGSILGDKTRMGDLARQTDAFIRPSPAGPMLGGVARRTRETVWLCEAAGFDLVIVETVGVGQSETAVADLVDLCLLMIAPGGGDELQGIKKGIVEIADLLVVNKADGDLAPAAQRAASEYSHALWLLRPVGAAVPVFAISALEKRGVEKLRQHVEAAAHIGTQDGSLDRKRAAQARAALWNELGESLLEVLKRDPAVAKLVPALESGVAAARLTPSAAASRALAAFRGSGTWPDGVSG
ncbi:MAG: methylmalonyl Co-A mutase-associated GTPase MeaB [Alphaproteobacteria bacterium]|nr:methylmalonyl Co-A mutase-associated GTPase MeaB [Alphaproteobacteria bacterium]